MRDSKPPLTAEELARILKFESDPLIQRLGLELQKERAKCVALGAALHAQKVVSPPDRG